MCATSWTPAHVDRRRDREDMFLLTTAVNKLYENSVDTVVQLFRFCLLMAQWLEFLSILNMFLPFPLSEFSDILEVQWAKIFNRIVIFEL